MKPHQDQPILSVSGLTVTFPKLDGSFVDVVKGVDLSVGAGEIVGLVGESGAGKTMVGLSLLDLVPQNGVRTVDSIRLKGDELANLSPKETQALRGRDIAMVFQDPMSSFNPVRSIGTTMIEVLQRYQDLSTAKARTMCIEALTAVGVPAAEQRFDAYPHELSGGLRQRVMIALATINNPSLLIADEPTTALDTTIQSQILELLRDRLGERGMILITHDLGVAAEVCDRIVVMLSGRFVEVRDCARILTEPQHDYTQALIRAVPCFRRPYVTNANGPRNGKEQPLIAAKDVRVTFRTNGRDLHAVNGIDIDLWPGETVGLVGESGSGKSTLISALIGIHKPSKGSVLFDGQETVGASEQSLIKIRRRLQMVFQDPYASLNPRWTVERIIAEPLRAQRIGNDAERVARVRDVVSLVGLPDDSLKRRPSQFSGGQHQRIAIARALVLNPDILIADEPVAALDVSMQAQIVTLLKTLQTQFGIGYLIVAHDLALMHHIADRIVVMYLGEVVEEGESKQVTSKPLHPYTAALLSAAPDPDPGQSSRRIVLRGEPPSPLDPPTGCAFHSRCPIAKAQCAEKKPVLTQIGGQKVACHFPGQLPLDPHS